MYTPQVNHISLQVPSGPLLVKGRERDTRRRFCNLTSLEDEGRDCTVEFCHCLHVLSVPQGSVVDVLLVDEGGPCKANHPFHLHGNHFRVLGMGKVGGNASREETEKLLRRGEIRTRLEDAPFKDTVTVPSGGYTLIRFLADNPGYWMMHCHLDYHMELGMGLVWEVGDPASFPLPPRGFPVCDDYIPSAGTEAGATTTTETATTEQEGDEALLLTSGEVATTFSLLAVFASVFLLASDLYA
ncbi:unnamed protein product [Darwinula stevensoni]|uniref:Plastocyanin-like domain-containing protein n=1 Tax=Darwinula stevensoni TaxID=69355 RepID=A0A7R9FS54_9CRUS|nr:unnamed protein product [Darwinula stevensoni]CAG0903076.1 unnamed protein product [Darwinula stevensoni]